MVVNDYRYETWCSINPSMVENSAGSSDPWWNEGLLISHSVLMICRVSLHLWSMKPTRAWEIETLITLIPPFIVICSNLCTRILDRCSPSYDSMALHVIERISYDISRNPTTTISSMKVSTTRYIKLMLCVYHLATWFNRRPVSHAAKVLAFYWAPCLNMIVLLRIHAPVKDCYRSNHPCRFSMIIVRA